MSSMSMAYRLTAGPTTVEFEPDTGWLRSVCSGERQHVLAVYAAVRDENWKTLEPQVEVVADLSQGDSFCLVWQAKYPSLGFSFTGLLMGDPSGVVSYQVTGAPTKPFSSMRAGLCLLHPLTDLGAAVHVTHSDGSVENGALPDLISPHQPFKDITSIQVGGHVSIEFFGETFEMEDQRNWCDASFKTYCRSNDWPAPYLVDKEFTQTIRITPLSSKAPAQVAALPEGKVPELGFKARPKSLERTVVGSIYCDLSEEGWTEEELADLAQKGDLIASWAPGHITCPAWAVAIADPDHAAPAREAFPGSKLLLEGRGSFVGLNRMEPKPACDGVIFGICPQVHSTDERSIMENLWAIPEVVRSARAIAGDGLVIAGPIKFSWMASGMDDRRNNTVFGTEWTSTALWLLAVHGVDRAICFEDGELIWGRLDGALALAKLAGTKVSQLPGSEFGQTLQFMTEVGVRGLA